MAVSSRYDEEEQLARIRLAGAEMDRTAEETRKFIIEQRKLFAEQRMLERDHTFAPWKLVVSGMTAGAAFLGAGFGLAKLFGV